MTLVSVIARLGNVWNTMHPYEYAQRSRAIHACGPSCPMICVTGFVHSTAVSDEPDAKRALHPCLVHPCPKEGALEYTVQRECWVCRSSGVVHLCGEFCAQWMPNDDKERVCQVTCCVLPDAAPSQVECVQRDRGPWAPMPVLTSDTRLVVSRAKEYQMRGAWTAFTGVWRELLGSQADLREHLERICRQGWCTLGDTPPTFSNADGLDMLLVRCARQLSHMYARSPRCPIEERLRASREVVLAAVEAGKRAMAADRTATFDVAAAVTFTQLERRPPPSTWIPAPERRATGIFALVPPVLALWHGCTSGRLPLQGSNASFERFVLAAVQVLGTGVLAIVAGCAFATFSPDRRLADLPLRETATSPAKHEDLVQRITAAVRSAAESAPHDVLDPFTFNLNEVPIFEWKQSLAAAKRQR